MPKKIPPRALALAANPNKAYEILKASQLAEQLCDGDNFSAEEEKPDGAVRFVIISDTHSYESKKMAFTTALEQVPAGDVLLHCGDFTNIGEVSEVEAFANWFAKLPHKRKIVIAGNHDLSFEASTLPRTGVRYGHKGTADPDKTCAKARALLDAIPNCVYLEDSGTTVEGIKVWGSPWQPEFCEWAFNLPRGEPCRAKWRLIPDETDVLLTHGPPLGHGDLCSSGHRAGCVDLLDEIQSRVKPAVHAFGHIHEGAGVTTDGATLYVNASTCNLRYRPVNSAIVLDVLPPDPAQGRARAQVAQQTLAAAGVASMSSEQPPSLGAKEARELEAEQSNARRERKDAAMGSDLAAIGSGEAELIAALDAAQLQRQKRDGDDDSVVFAD